MDTTTSSESHVHLDFDGTDPVVDETPVDENAVVSAAGSSPDDEAIVDEDADLDPADRLPRHAIRNRDGSVTLPLKYPRTLMTRKDGKVRERTFTELVFHRLTGADQRAIGATSSENQGVTAFARSTRINQAVMSALFDKMDAADIQAGGQVLNNFFVSGPRTRTGSRASA